MVKFPHVNRKGAVARYAARQAPEGLWDRPLLLDLLADLLFLCSIAALAYAVLVTMMSLPLFPLRQVVVVNVLSRVTPAQIEYAARTSLAGNFFTVNLDSVRLAFEKLSWVRKTSVRRHWPDGLDLTIEEHVAAARWYHSEDEARLVNNQGEVFAASLADQATLPLFGGPEGSAPLILGRYREFVELLAPLGRSVRGVVLSARQAWQLRLDDGLILELGRDQAKQTLRERLQRFVGVYRDVQARAKTSIAAIDMRYPNGFALRPGRSGTGANRDAHGAERLGKGNT